MFDFFFQKIHVPLKKNCQECVKERLIIVCFLKFLGSVVDVFGLTFLHVSSITL